MIIKIEGNNLSLVIPLEEPYPSSGGRMFLIASTKGFEEMIINGVKVKIMLQIGWNIYADEEGEFGLRPEKAMQWFNRLIGKLKPRKSKQRKPIQKLENYLS